MEEQKETGINYNSLFKTLAISVITAFFSYVLLFLYTNYAALYFAYDFDIPAYVDLGGVCFPSENDVSTWSRDAVITILLSKPLSAVIIGIPVLIIMMIGFKKPIAIVMVLFWVNIFAFNNAFGLLIDDAIARSGTYEVAVVMNLGEVTIITGSIILAFLLYKIGMMNGRLIIMSFPNQSLTNTKNRIIFFSIVFLIPWLIVIFYIYLMDSDTVPLSQMIKNLPVALLLIPFLTAGKIKNKKFNYMPSVYHSKSDLIYTVLFAFLSIVMIFVLKNGFTITG